MKLAILGGGGFRVPLIYRALVDYEAQGVIDEIRLYDTNYMRLDAIRKVIHRLQERSYVTPRLSVTTDLREAINGVDFIFSAIRVGGIHGRAHDEKIARELGILGQETTGFGGISYALRGLPIALDIAHTIVDINPEAWVINFTNPAGIVTEACQRILGDRVIGICDSALGLAARAAQSACTAGFISSPRDTTADILNGTIGIDYCGLNHLGWLTGLYVDGTDILPRVLTSSEALSDFTEGRLFGRSWLSSLKCLPNEYLHYYYFTREIIRADANAAATRGHFLAEQQHQFYTRVDQTPSEDALELWKTTWRERESTYMATNYAVADKAGTKQDEHGHVDLGAGGYDQIAAAIIQAIGCDEPAHLVLNVANRGTISFLSDDAVIEVPCVVDAHGVHPLPVSSLPEHARGLVHSIKNVEQTVIQAVETKSWDLVIQALAIHPLVDGVGTARLACEALQSRFPELAYLRS